MIIKKLNQKQKRFLIIGGLVILIFLINDYQSGRSVIFGTTSFTYSVYNEKEEGDYDRPVITPPLKIGLDITITGSMPEYVCPLTQDKVSPSVATKDCWKGTFQFEDAEGSLIEGTKLNATLSYGEEVNIGKYFYITWLPSGRYRGEYDCPTEKNPNKKCTGFKPYQWRSDYKIKLAGDFLQAYFDDKERLVRLNSNKSSKIKIKNDLSNKLNGGLFIRSQQLLYYKEGTEFVNIQLKREVNDYEIHLDSSILGYDTITILPYIKFDVPRGGTVTVYDDRLSKVTYNIVPNIDTTVDTSINCENRFCPDGFYCETVTHKGDTYKICLRGEAPKQSTTESTGDLPLGDVIQENGPEIPPTLREEVPSYVWWGIIIVIGLMFIITKPDKFKKTK